MRHEGNDHLAKLAEDRHLFTRSHLNLGTTKVKRKQFDASLIETNWIDDGQKGILEV